MKKSPFSWFKYHDADKILVKAKRFAYIQKCQHFETSGIGIDKSEKTILTKFKKNCHFCKVEKTHKKQRVTAPAESTSWLSKLKSWVSPGNRFQS